MKNAEVLGKGERQGILGPSPDSVGRLARVGVVWTLILTFGSQFISVCTTIVLSRLLLPSDYGIMGMVATFTALVAVVSGMGLSWATVQRKHLTHTQVHNLFWINVVAGVVAWAICYVVASPLARFFEEDAVAAVTKVLGFTFVLAGISAQPTALLQRNMRFRAITIVELAASLLGTVAAIVVALYGWGYWALVANGVVTQSTRMILVLGVSRYRPHLPKRDPGTISMVTFGGYLTLSGIVTYLSRNTDNILIGRFWGSEILGYYARAYFLMTLPTMIITHSLSRVMIPSLSRLADSPTRLGDAYGRALEAMVIVGFPIAIGVGVSAQELIYLVYGSGWEPVAPILAWLSIAMANQLVTGSNGWLYMATGKGRPLFFVGIASSLVFLVVFFVSVPKGVNTVAASYAIASVLVAVPSVFLAHRFAGIPLLPTVRRLSLPLLFSLLMGMLSGVAGALVYLLGGSWLVVLIAKVVVGVGFYGTVSFLFLPLARRYIRSFLDYRSLWKLSWRDGSL